MTTHSLAGVLPIVQIPFDLHFAIDWEVLRREVHWAFEQGAAGIGTGMVSEIKSLARAERAMLAERLVEFSDGRGPVFMAVTADTRRESMQFAADTKQSQCDAVMAAPPTQEKLDSNALIQYYSDLADALDGPIIVQDASGYLGETIPIEVYLELLHRHGHEKILFKPESPPNGPNLSRLRDASGGKAKMFEGSGGIYLIDSMRRGVLGTMPGMELLDGIVAIWQAMRRGDEAHAYEVYLPLCAIVALQIQAGLDGFLAIEKYLLCRRGIFLNEIRREPVRWKLDSETAKEVDRLFDRLTLAMKQPATIGAWKKP